MKIVFITSGTIKSSISYRPLSLARELHKKGHDVSIIAPRFDKYSKFVDNGINEIDGVTIVRPTQIRFLSFEFGLLPYIISSIAKLHSLKPDIVHIYKPNPITLVGLAGKFISKAPFILDTDDIDSEVMKVEKNHFLKIKLVQLSEKIAARNATAIILGSKYLVKFYKSQYKKKLITQIPNGADFKKIDLINTKTLSQNRIIFIGALNRINILEPLFYALKEIKQENPNIKAVIMGDGKYLSYFKNLSRQLGLTKNIAFLGWVPQKDLYKYVQVGDIGYSYMPNELTIKSCSSMKVFQYMQFGSVPLVSNVGDFPLYTFNGKAGYIVKHSSVPSLTKSLIQALSDNEERRKKISYSIVHAKKYYKWSVLAEKTEVVYKNII